MSGEQRRRSGHVILGALRSLMVALLVLPVRAYQLFISPLFGPTCRFYPSCSTYAVTALRVHGPVIGIYLAIRRLLRCHPWNPGGVDHVPPRRRRSSPPTTFESTPQQV